jgi:hypothetical protein
MDKAAFAGGILNLKSDLTAKTQRRQGNRERQKKKTTMCFQNMPENPLNKIRLLFAFLGVFASWRLNRFFDFV